MLAVAEPPPAVMLAPIVFTVIVNVWFVPTALVAVAGVIWMFASAQVLLAGPLLAAVPSVVRVSELPATGMFDVAETTVVPCVAEVITTVQLAVAAPPA